MIPFAPLASAQSVASDLQTNFGSGRGCGATAEIVTAAKRIRNSSDALGCTYYGYDPKDCKLVNSFLILILSTSRTRLFCGGQAHGGRMYYS